MVTAIGHDLPVGLPEATPAIDWVRTVRFSLPAAAPASLLSFAPSAAEGRVTEVEQSLSKVNDRHHVQSRLVARSRCQPNACR